MLAHAWNYNICHDTILKRQAVPRLRVPAILFADSSGGKDVLVFNDTPIGKWRYNFRQFKPPHQTDVIPPRRRAICGQHTLIVLVFRHTTGYCRIVQTVLFRGLFNDVVSTAVII
jgi:hypothetical protein